MISQCLSTPSCDLRCLTSLWAELRLPPTNSYAEALIAGASECDCFRDRAFKEVINIKWGHLGGP